MCLGFLAHASSYMLSLASLSASLSMSSKFLGVGLALELFRFDFLLGASVFGFLRTSLLAIFRVCASHLSKSLGVAPPWERWDLRIVARISLGVLCVCRD